MPKKAPFNKIVTLCLLAVVSLMPLAVHAFYGTALEMRVGDVYCRIYNNLLGTTAQGLASIAVVILGLAAIYGKADRAMCIIVISGIVVLFGSAALVDFTIGSALPFGDYLDPGVVVDSKVSCDAAQGGKAVTQTGALIDATASQPAIKNLVDQIVN